MPILQFGLETYTNLKRDIRFSVTFATMSEGSEGSEEGPTIMLRA